MLEDIKNYLRITGTDEDNDIQKRILKGRARLEGLAGVALDFESEGLPKSLLFDFCRYDYSNASEYFEENYKAEILRLQLQCAVTDYEKNKS